MSPLGLLGGVSYTPKAERDPRQRCIAATMQLSATFRTPLKKTPLRSRPRRVSPNVADFRRKLPPRTPKPPRPTQSLVEGPNGDVRHGFPAELHNLNQPIPYLNLIVLLRCIV